MKTRRILNISESFLKFSKKTSRAGSCSPALFFSGKLALLLFLSIFFCKDLQAYQRKIAKSPAPDKISDQEDRQQEHPDTAQIIEEIYRCYVYIIRCADFFCTLNGVSEQSDLIIKLYERLISVSPQVQNRKNEKHWQKLIQAAGNIRTESAKNNPAGVKTEVQHWRECSVLFESVK